MLTMTKYAESKKPNFIFILTDDQDIYFDSPSIMPSLLSNIRDAGMTFNNGFVATSICCPSRTESLTGRFYHNVREQDDSLNSCMHVAAQYNTVNNTKNLFYSFQNAGYLTGAFGKFINDQDVYWCDPVAKGQIPSTNGFSKMNFPCEEDYYQQLYFEKNIDGSYMLHNITKEPANYLTSYIGNQTIYFLNEAMTAYTNKPFMIWYDHVFYSYKSQKLYFY